MSGPAAISQGSGLWPNGASVSQGGIQTFYPANMRPNSSLEQTAYSVSRAGLPADGPVSYKDHVDQMVRFFGQPLTQLHERSAEDLYDTEYLNLPQAFEGTNVKIRTVLIDLIRDAELYPIKILCPLERQESSMTIQWDVLHFNHHTLNRQPEESIPRMLSFNKSSGSESFVRWDPAVIVCWSCS